jgi:hypothetical protein
VTRRQPKNTWGLCLLKAVVYRDCALLHRMSRLLLPATLPPPACCLTCIASISAAFIWPSGAVEPAAAAPSAADISTMRAACCCCWRHGLGTAALIALRCTTVRRGRAAAAAHESDRTCTRDISDQRTQTEVWLIRVERSNPTCECSKCAAGRVEGRDSSQTSPIQCSVQTSGCRICNRCA